MNALVVPGAADVMNLVVLTTMMLVLGIVLNYIVPSQTFEIVLYFGAIAILCMWSMIVLAHLGYLRAAEQGKVERRSYRAPLGAAGDWIVLVCHKELQGACCARTSRRIG